MKFMIFAMALMGAGTAQASDFVLPGEPIQAVPMHSTSAILLSDFVENSIQPAAVLQVLSIDGQQIILVERDGKHAALVSQEIMDRLTLRIEGEGQDKKQQGGYCDSSCIDDAVGKGLSGSLGGAKDGAVVGAAVGAGAGAYVGGLPGAGLGGFIGGGVGAVGGGAVGGTAGAIEGYNTCEKEKHDKCKDGK
jgi:hypothetical protein